MNFYYIWIPPYNKIIIIRVVYFRKEKIFNNNTKIFKSNIKKIFFGVFSRNCKKGYMYGYNNNITNYL